MKNPEKMSVAALEAAVRKHNNLYFVEHHPEISDEEFDHLVAILKKQKPNSPVLSEVGSDVGGAAKTVRHERPMLSLDKCYNDEDLFHWASKFEGDVVAMPKIDGCAITLHYDGKGSLQLCSTRGSGAEGEVITSNVFHVQSIPQQIILKNVEVRGEVYMPLSVFENYRDTFANPRNLAAGAIKQKDPKKTGEYRLSFFAYDLLDAGCKTEMEKRTLLERSKIPVVPASVVTKEKMPEAFQFFYKKRNGFDFETDGVVFKINSVAQQEKVGDTAHHPRFAIAYKFQGDSGETTVEDVLWSVARTSVITPVAVVAPVELSGATVTRVSLHNYGLAKKSGVGVGAKVLMVRRGGVIPYVELVLKTGKSLQAPKVCPSCNAKVEQREDFLYCTNPNGCTEAKVGELEHFVKTVGIDSFGRKLLQKLVEEGMVKDAADLYLLTTDDLMPLERMGETLAAKLVRHMQNAKSISMDVFLQALGISELGKHASTLLASFGDLKKIRGLKKEELVSIHGIGERIAENVVKGLKEKTALLDRLLKVGVSVKGVRRLSGGPLQGKTFLFTGSLVGMDRKVAEKKVAELGGQVVSGVSKNLHYLVVGESPGSKLKKAEALRAEGCDIQILSEKDFLQMTSRLSS